MELLAARDDVERIVVADVNPPRFFLPKVQYERLDVRDGAACRELIGRCAPDTLVHLAFILNPLHDEGLMYEVDVNGTSNVLEAAGDAGTGHVLVTSSTTAYGAWPDNPVPITEDWPVRGVPDYAYARDKAESDRLCQLWALRYPERTMTIVRPCIVFGPNVDNYLVRFWTKQPFQADTGNLDLPMQFVHEEDVVDAIGGLAAGPPRGGVQRHGRRHAHDARGRRGGRAADPALPQAGLHGLREGDVGRSRLRGAAGAAAFHRAPVGGLQREGQADAGLAAQAQLARDVREDHRGAQAA